MALIAGALTTVETAKGDLGITDASQDDVLSRFINAASEAVARYCGRRFEFSANLTEKVAGHGGRLLVLERTPLVAVASVKINGRAVTDFTLYHSEAGLLFRAAGWPWAVGAAGPFEPDPLPGAEDLNIEVEYSGGYVTPQQENDAKSATPPAVLPRTLPFDLEQYCIDLVASWYRQRGSDKAVVSERLMSAGVQYERAAGGLPESVALGLNSYRRAI